ncbi:MAG TPA: sigma-70 family RNA polymerase sigma factor [Candidatus Eisenbacteria bacterium]|nr:sigma-70 family RNA polymerase sigma factor [Candidatus Eisenbacteria bacterium]
MTGNVGRRVVDLVHRARDRRAPVHEQHAAFAMLVERFEEMAYATALRGCADTESARDACQDAFLVAWHKLPDLREPAAFGGWLKRLVRTQCDRARRRRGASSETLQSARARAGGAETAGDAAELFYRREVQRLIRDAIGGLPAREREAVILFYFLGESLRVVARVLGVRVGTAGKLVYGARLRLRRCLPRSITEAFLVVGQAPAFTRNVQAGVFDEFVGEYRFASRPAHKVIVRREGGLLASYAGGQRNVLASRERDSLSATEFDGEARFQRNRRGRVINFVYYEFGRRLGVAHKVA